MKGKERTTLHDPGSAAVGGTGAGINPCVFNCIITKGLEGVYTCLGQIINGEWCGRKPGQVKMCLLV